MAQALKGRNNSLVRRNLLRPFRARKLVSAFDPRALPWADLFEPFGLQTGPLAARGSSDWDWEGENRPDWHDDPFPVFVPIRSRRSSPRCRGFLKAPLQLGTV